MDTSSVNTEARKNLDMRTGDNVRVSQKIEDKGGKTRIQIFEGMVLARKHGTEAGATFTVRRVANGYGVEKIFPLYSPMIDKIEITKRSKSKRSKLYYIREKALKQISKRMKMMFVDIKEEEKEETPAEEVVENEAPAEEVVENEAPAEESGTELTEEVTEPPAEEAAENETPAEEVEEEAPAEEKTEENK